MSRSPEFEAGFVRAEYEVKTPSRIRLHCVVAKHKKNLKIVPCLINALSRALIFSLQHSMNHFPLLHLSLSPFLQPERRSHGKYHTRKM